MKKEKRLTKKEKKELFRLEQERIREAIDNIPDDHPAPVTRRDFLSYGIIQFSGLMMAPTALQLLAKDAFAAECGTSGADQEQASTMIPVITVNLSGGAGLASNFMPHDIGRQRLGNYDKMGLGSGGNIPNIEREFGNAPFAGRTPQNPGGPLVSKFLEGVREQAVGNSLARTAFVASLVRSGDDRATNKFDISGMAAKAGSVGQKLPNLGAVNSQTGIRQAAAIVAPPSPLVVNNYNDIAGALGGAVGNSAMAQFSPNQKSGIYRLMNRLSKSQAGRLIASTGGKVLGDLTECSTQKNLEISEDNTTNIDPRTDNRVQAIWGIDTDSSVNARNVFFATMVYNTILGNSGTSNLELGGYDYHNNTRTRGDGMDRDAGRLIGRILSTADALNRKVFLYVTTDGAVQSPVSSSNSAVWQSDRGSAGCSYILAYDPAGRPATTDFQIGQFTTGQAADDSFVTGWNPEKSAAAVIANYLKLNNRMDLLNKVAPGIFSTTELNKVIKFG